MKVTDIAFEYTGGGINTYYGKLDNGMFFVFGNNVLMICDADYAVTFTDRFFEKTGGDDTYTWEKKHTKEKYDFSSKDYKSFPDYASDIIIQSFRLLEKDKSHPGCYDGYWEDLCEIELCRNNEVMSRYSKKENAKYWDRIDNAIENMLNEIADLSTSEINDTDWYGNGLITDIRKIIIKRMEELDGNFPYISENM